MYVYLAFTTEMFLAFAMLMFRSVIAFRLGWHLMLGCLSGRLRFLLPFFSPQQLES
jgi:hypothetical protein